LSVLGDISLVNTAVIAVLTGTPVVEPVFAVAGTVKVTLGRVKSAVAPVVKFQMNGLSNASPVATLFAPVIVAV
jgi:hypothetical protein